MEEKILEVSIEELYDRAQEYMRIMCGHGRSSSMAKKSQVQAAQVREEVFNGQKMPFLIKKIMPENVKEDCFEIENIVLKCGALANIDLSSVKGGYVFILRSPVPDISKLPISRMYLADSWETCFVDAGRDWLREELLRISEEETGEQLYISDTFAPGMAKISSESVPEFFNMLNPESIDISLMESGMMNPVKSFVGIYLLIDKEQMISTMNCAECLSGHKGCEYCKNYASMYMEGEAANPIQLADRTILERWLK